MWLLNCSFFFVWRNILFLETPTTTNNNMDSWTNNYFLVKLARNTLFNFIRREHVKITKKNSLTANTHLYSVAKRYFSYSIQYTWLISKTGDDGSEYFFLFIVNAEKRVYNKNREREGGKNSKVSFCVLCYSVSERARYAITSV